ncbi:CaiB/BaiF CoA-transferase family protein [Pararhodobacter sp. SW119]|uniref:CaiB/BaiF CoA transferase family protein n=1 Tax=Pararhodobacter sp. SW119 TaxID=2780075 RepID=UPI001ADF67F6|nr:CaiB/BaiF CoA-transferase family protein [Pararhodobacter sp. SW119]
MRPLEGLQVIAIEQAVAAPFASSRLADAGAHVVKIERPEGDFARGYDAVASGQSSYFVWLNRGKESLTLNLGRATGKARLGDLIAGADVLIQNLKPGALGRLGFDLARLHAENPRLISCSISGFGDEGPMADRKAYDLLIQAESGLCSITGGPSEPARVGISDREWRLLARDVIGDEGLGTDPRFATNLARVEHRPETDALVAAAFARHDADAAIALLTKADIAWASVNDMAGLSAHPHLRRVRVESPGGPVSIPAPGARFRGEDRAYGPVPALDPAEE